MCVCVCVIAGMEGKRKCTSIHVCACYCEERKKERMNEKGRLGESLERGKAKEGLVWCGFYGLLLSASV